MRELLDPCVQGPSVGVGMQKVLPGDLLNSPGSGQVGLGISSCHFSGQAESCVLKLLAGHLSAGTGLPGGSNREFVPAGL